MTGKPGRPKKNDKKKRFGAWIQLETYTYLASQFPQLESFGEAVDMLVNFHRNSLRQKIDSATK
jgi:hypothetical protein